tara:strand:+ start:162 stop:785 length:624 start_codon:yes stop_codon:yes gene_type:complete
MTTYADQYEWLRAQPKWRTILNGVGLKSISRKLTVDAIIPTLKARFPHIKLPWNVQAHLEVQHEKNLRDLRNKIISMLNCIQQQSNMHILRLSKYEEYFTPEFKEHMEQIMAIREFPKIIVDKVENASKDFIKLTKLKTTIDHIDGSLTSSLELYNDDNPLIIEMKNKFRLDNPIKPIAPRIINISSQELFNCGSDVKGLLFYKLSN